MNDRHSRPTTSDTVTPLGSSSALSDVRIHPETGAAMANYDHGVDPLSVAIPEMVARCEDCHPCSLPPMYDSVDPEALDELFSTDQRAASGLGISFDYAGYTVKVDTDSLSVTSTQ
jgi:hypothetical protein